MPEESAQIDVQALWAEVNALLHEGAVNRAVWDAAEAAVPLTLDGDTLILGLTPKDMRHASYLQTDVNRARLRQILQARSGRFLDLRVIEGTSVEDWERVKQRESAAEEQVAQQVRRVAEYRGSAAVWEQANQELSALATGTRARAYPTVKARLLVRAFPLIADAEQEARANDAEAEDEHQRYLNRLLERVATYTDLPPTAVALEYLRFAAAHQRTEGS